MNRPELPQGYDNVPALEKTLAQDSETSRQKRAEQRALNLFKDMATSVPAYKDFLQSRKFNPGRVKSISDFTDIPAIDKDNYLRKYPLDQLCWDGKFPGGQWVISSTSGSTGKPFYFPRQHAQDLQYAISAELYLRSNFAIHQRSTLYIVAFPMGAWIGGVFTYEALKIVADSGKYDLSIITPGVHKQEVTKAILELGHRYDQVIIGAYAPFLKDILDDGHREGIDWKAYNLGFVFSAEAFSEKFRDYVLETIGKPDDSVATLNHYGTVDLGTMAHETPESVLIRRTLVKDNRLEKLFPEDHRQPTFAQYDPELFYFEEEGNNLLCTAYSGLPLVRYDLKDYGGVVTRDQVHQKLAKAGIDIPELSKQHGIESKLWDLPFVYVYERNDLSVSYYAFLIYPDTIRRALQQAAFTKELTGKFSMQVDYDNEGRQRLHVHIETKHGVTHTDKLNATIQKALHEGLVEESSEYRETNRVIGADTEPIIYLWEYEDPTHFRAGAKQKWVIK